MRKGFTTVIASTVSLLLSMGVTWACVGGVEMYAGTVTLDSPSGGTGSTGATSINFQQSYDNPPLIFILPSDVNPDPATMRVQSVTTSGFVVGSTESDGEDGVSPAESFTYLAIDPGPTGMASFTVGGMQVNVGTITTDEYQSNRFGGDGYANITFTPAFPGGVTPIVIHEVQSFANDPTYDFDGGDLTAPWLETIGLQATATNTTFQVALERAENSAGGTTIANPETIAYLAIEPGAGTFNDGSGPINFNAFETADNITGDCRANAHGVTGTGGTPIAVGVQARRDGNNGGWIRQCTIDGTNITLQVDEDRANDAERNHTTESAAIWAFSEAFSVDLTGSGGPKMEVTSAVTDPQTATGGALGFTSVSFPRAFSETPLIFTMPTTEGILEPASVRIRGRTPTGFQVAQVQPEGESGGADAMTIDYLAITPKTHTLQDGATIIEAGLVTTDAYQGSQVTGDAYFTLNFANTFANPPALILDIQSIASEPLINPSFASVPWLEMGVDNNSISTTSARIAMDRAQTDSGTVVPEDIGYLAIESNQSVAFSAANGAGSASTDVVMKSLLTPVNINGVDDTPGCYVNTYPGGAFAATPLAIGNIASRFGGDGGWLRRCSNSTTQLGLVVDEDRDLDTERSHGGTEQGSFVAVSESFAWCPTQFNIMKNSSVVRDPVNTTTNPKSIPDALVSYQIAVSNEAAPAATSNSITVSDSIPAGTSLYIQADPSQGNQAPFVFADGATASGLTFTYGGPTDMTDDVEFSMNSGVDGFGYMPTPVNGVDSQITDIRINPKGVFNGMLNNTNTPSFTVTFHVVVD